MGSVAREDGVLKLVYPGKVEIHTKPITAAQVLKKYPRHSVTRPDIFEYPWVVVKPESVLNLGKVFFIVPNLTIYNLLKAHGKRHQHSPHKNLSPEKRVNQQQAQNQESPRKINAGSTPKRLNPHRQLNHSPPTASCMWISSLDKNRRDLRTRRQNKVGTWPEDMSRNKNTLLRLEEKPVKDSRTKTRSSNLEKYHNIDKNIRDFTEMEDDSSEFKHSREVIMLKSCLRKPDSIRRSLQLRVSFLMPSKDEQQRRVKRSQEVFAGNNSRSFADVFACSTRLIPTSI